MFWFQMTLAAIALALILTGIWHEDKVIAFEDRMADRIGYHIAQIIIRHRKKKAKKLAAQRRAHYNSVAQARRSQIHVVKSNRSDAAQAGKYIA
ncbi:MAG: hypothetical protein IIW48_08575 [Clostridia bacterium]|nr:hypothetical protein [Clostridia bacterium]